MLNFTIDGQETNVIYQDLKLRYKNNFTHFEKELEGEMWVKDLYDYITAQNYDHNFEFIISGDYDFSGYFLKTDIIIYRSHESIKIENVRETNLYQEIKQVKDRKHKIGDLNVNAESLDYDLEPSFLFSSLFNAHRFWDILKNNGYNEFSATDKASFVFLENRYYKTDYPEHSYTNDERQEWWIYIPYKDTMSQDFWGMYYYYQTKNYLDYNYSEDEYRRYERGTSSYYYLKYKYETAFLKITVFHSSNRYQGSVNVVDDGSGSYVKVKWNSGDKFNVDWPAGKRINILGGDDFIEDVIDNETLTVQNGFSSSKSDVEYYVETEIIVMDVSVQSNSNNQTILCRDSANYYYAILEIELWMQILSDKKAADFPAWDSNVTYSAQDIVEQNGEVYEALEQNTGVSPENNYGTSSSDTWLKRSNDRTSYLQNYENAYNPMPIDYAGSGEWIGFYNDSDITILVTHNYSTSNTGYGKIRRGPYTDYYYTEPDTTYNVIPFAKEWWAEFSIWIAVGDFDHDTKVEDFKIQQTVEDNYSLQYLVDALLEANGISDKIEISGGIIIAQNHNPLPEATQPLNLYLTPSTNVAFDDYYFPASANEISLQKIFDILKGVNLFWDINTFTFNDTKYNVLVFEHFYYYNNGKKLYENDAGDSYYDSNAVDLDLTAIQARNGSYWADTITKTNYSETKKNKFINYSTLDAKSKNMDAQLEILNNLVENSMEIKLEAYIDFFVVTRLGEDVQKDNWVLINTDDNGNVERTEVNGYPILNGSLFGENLLKEFHRHGLPGNIKIKGIEYSIVETERLLEEEYKGIAGDFNIDRLVKTYTGAGKITDLTLYLNNRKAEITIKQKL